ncbi:hypothetical protein HYS28_03240 [Candidatus Uhrbacteria bacterium]|nr:hypothetical protein [Candidatus Uhrbacteria bacterium]
MLDILTIGDIKLDTFIVIPHASIQCELRQTDCKLCLDYGKKIPVESTHSQIAGSAPNVAVGIATMKKSSAVLSVMGRDITHMAALQFLKEHRVGTQYISPKAKKNSSFAAVLNFQGESTQLVAHSAVDIRLPKNPPKAAWMHISELGKGYDRLFRDLTCCAKEHNVRISFNPGQIHIDERKKSFFDLIAASEVLFINLREARELLRTPASTSIKKVLHGLYGLGADDVVVTDGQNGAYAYDGKAIVHAPMFPGKRVEATGAGDAFAAGYLGALLHGKKSEDALMWGSVNAASVVGKVGPTAGLLTHAEIMKRLAGRKSYTTKTL